MKPIIVTVASISLLLSASAAQAEAFSFGAKASGAQEVTDASIDIFTATTGKLALTFEKDLTSAAFVLDVLAGTGITQAHLHCAPAGLNGPVVVVLFDTVNGGAVIDGELASGVLTNADIMPIDPVASPACGVTINNIASLQAAASAGRVYVNVHSEVFSAGVVRGQLFDLFNEHLIELIELGLIEGHTHIYLTGRGKGHNNTSAETSPALLP